MTGGYDREKYMTCNEAAEYLGRSREFVVIRAKRGLFKTKKHGHWLLLEREDVKNKKGKQL